MTTNIAPKPTPEQLQKLAQWDAAKTALAAAKETEMNLRKECAALIFPDAAVGTNRVELPEGYSLKMVRKVNYKLDADNEKVDSVQDKVAAMGNEGAFLAPRLFKWTVELSVSEYKKLDPANPTHAKIKKTLDAIITTEDGAPTMEVEAPKAKKA